MEMCKLLIDRIFNGNDAVYGLTCQAVEEAIAHINKYNTKPWRNERSTWCDQISYDKRTSVR